MGIQLLGFTVISFWFLVFSWLYFFGFKRCKVLRVRKAEELLGSDAVSSAKYKGLDISKLLEMIGSKFPELKRKGC